MIELKMDFEIKNTYDEEGFSNKIYWFKSNKVDGLKYRWLFGSHGVNVYQGNKEIDYFTFDFHLNKVPMVRARSYIRKHDKEAKA